MMPPSYRDAPLTAWEIVRGVVWYLTVPPFVVLVLWAVAVAVMDVLAP